jgi:hypothetical protein
VIKIEPPQGDPHRFTISAMKGNQSTPYKSAPHFYQVNRGKKSVVRRCDTRRAKQTRSQRSSVLCYEHTDSASAASDALRRPACTLVTDGTGTPRRNRSST